jgi:hypothetical protein
MEVLTVLPIMIVLIDVERLNPAMIATLDKPKPQLNRYNISLLFMPWFEGMLVRCNSKDTAFAVSKYLRGTGLFILFRGFLLSNSEMLLILYLTNSILIQILQHQSVLLA